MRKALKLNKNGLCKLVKTDQFAQTIFTITYSILSSHHELPLGQILDEIHQLILT